MIRTYHFWYSFLLTALLICSNCISLKAGEISLNLLASAPDTVRVCLVSDPIMLSIDNDLPGSWCGPALLDDTLGLVDLEQLPQTETGYIYEYKYVDPSLQDSIRMDTLLLYVLKTPRIAIDYTPVCEDKPAVALNNSVNVDSNASITLLLNGQNLSNVTANADTFFLPAQAGDSQLIINLSNANQCSDQDTLSIDVYATPTITSLPVPPNNCENDEEIMLMATPTGGTYFGNFINADGILTFGSSGQNLQAGYHYTNDFGCADTVLYNYDVNPKPTVDIMGLASLYCSSSPIDTIKGVPAGGLFVGDNIFNLGEEGLGLINALDTGSNLSISYSYTSDVGCSDTLSLNYAAHLSSEISMQGLETFYCTESPPDTIMGLPTGGSFEGVNIQNLGNGTASLTPDIVGDSLMLMYQYTNDKGCTTVEQFPFSVYQKPVLEISGLEQEYCVGDSLVTLSGNQAGGNFSGDFVTNDIFIDSLAYYQPTERGSDTIVYSFTSLEGCFNSIATITKVFGVPPDFVITATDTAFTSEVNAITLNSNILDTAQVFEYLWSNGAITPSLNITEAGFYTLQVKERGSNCVVSDTIFIDFKVTSVNDLGEEKKKYLKVFPNPFRDFLTIQNLSGENLNLEIFSLQGNLLDEIVLGKNAQEIWGENIQTNGLYLIRVNREQFYLIEKIR